MSAQKLNIFSFLNVKKSNSLSQIKYLLFFSRIQVETILTESQWNASEMCIIPLSFFVLVSTAYEKWLILVLWNLFILLNFFIYSSIIFFKKWQNSVLSFTGKYLLVYLYYSGLICSFTMGISDDPIIIWP